MWDAVRKIFRQDDIPEEGAPWGGSPDVGAETAGDAPETRTQPPTPVSAHVGGDVAPEQARAKPMRDGEGSATDASGPGAIPVSPPGHAPQGLAAEAAPQAEPIVESSEARVDSAVAPSLQAARVDDETADATMARAPTTLDDDSATSGRVVDGASAEAAPSTEPSSPVATPQAAPIAEPERVEMVGEERQDAGVPALAPSADEDIAASEGQDNVAPSPVNAAETGVADGAAEPEEDAAEPMMAEPTADGAAEPIGEPTVEMPAVLAPGAVVGDRYAIVEFIGESDGSRTYRAVDNRSYERCWSCGSEDNGPGTRFCQRCGAPIQDHQVVLAQTPTATGAPDELAQDGFYAHVQPERRRFGAEGIGVEIGAHSAEGPHHPNEDSYWYTTRTLCANSGRQSVALAIFADGMGGYAPGSGLISARIAAMAGAAIMASLDARNGASLAAEDAETIVREGIASANRMVLDEIARSGEMGATLVVALIHGDTAYVANVGDSRAYYIDPRGQASQITSDQSLVAQELGKGALSADDIYDAPGNNIILHAVGEADVEAAADWYVQPLEPDSLLVLCSDGYWKTMRGTLISEGVPKESATLNDMARHMVDEALAQGSDDNTTVLLIAVS